MQKANKLAEAKAKTNVKANGNTGLASELLRERNGNNNAIKPTNPNHNHPNRKCLLCGDPLKPTQKKYCSNAHQIADLNANKKAKKNGEIS